MRYRKPRNPISAAKARQIEASIKDCPEFMPKIEIGTIGNYWQKYIDKQGYRTERRIKARIIDEKPKGLHYQLKVKIEILSGELQGKTRWISRGSFAFRHESEG